MQRLNIRRHRQFPQWHYTRAPHEKQSPILGMSALIHLGLGKWTEI